MDNFKGSIAQKNVQFPIEIVIEPMAGENYSRGMIFIPSSLVSTYLSGIDDASAGKLYELTSANYADLSGGLLKSHLTPFFQSATAGKIGIAIFDDSESKSLVATVSEGDETSEIEDETPATPTTPTTPTEEKEFSLAKVYEKFKMYAYFKFGICESEKYNELQFELSNLCLADELYSDLWIGTSDKNVLKKTSALIERLTIIKSNARVIYNPDDSINPALAQLGKTLSEVNVTGTPVGNSVDMVGFNTISASGETDSDGDVQNLSATEIFALDSQKIGYNTAIGDGTKNVVTEGSLTLKGESVGANWVRNFITYMCKVKTASYITKMNKFRNNQTYQGVLLILQEQVSSFLNLGRLANFKLTAPVFADLPKSGDTIVVPNAWAADYVDNTREVTVFGTLYLTQPTK